MGIKKIPASLCWKPWKDRSKSISFSPSLLTFAVSSPDSHLLLELVSWKFQKWCPPKSVVTWQPPLCLQLWGGNSTFLTGPLYDKDLENSTIFLLIFHLLYIKFGNDLRMVKSLWRYWSTKWFINLVTHIKTGDIRHMLFQLCVFSWNTKPGRIPFNIL